ncbi:OmpA family protein [Vibrio sp. TRT 1302]|uniref:OmpA family protein n=1 Tax=Vibrio sp. TRT 1302 TaxID=3418504 RepID=UPI003CF19B96
MKFKLLTFSICMAVYSEAWSTPNPIDDDTVHTDYFGFATGYQPTYNYFSPKINYGVSITPSLVLDSRFGYNNSTELDSKNFQARVSLFGRTSFSSSTSLLNGSFIQYEDGNNPFQAGVSSILQLQLDKEVTLWGEVAAVVKKETEVKVNPEFTVGISWALSTSRQASSIISQPLSAVDLGLVTQDVSDPASLQQPATISEKAVIEVTRVFEVNSSYVTNDSALKESIQYLHVHPNLNARIVIKNSKDGPQEYNDWIGQRRVHRLREFYATHGIGIYRLEVSYSTKDEILQPLVQISYFKTKKS